MARLRVDVVSEKELDRIEETAFRLLDEIGISVEHERAVAMMHGAGCRVDKGRVFIPPAVVRKALDSLDRRARFCSADGKREILLGGGVIRAHNGGGMAAVIDSATGKRRPATLKDVTDSTRLLDALPNVDAIVPLFGPQDVPPALMIPASFAAMLRNTCKPIMAAGAESAFDVRWMVAMAEACCGGHEAFLRNPTLSIMVSPVSPLRLTEKVAEAILAVAKSGAQFQSLPCPMLGTTGPITIAGAVAQQHAEILASFVLAATARPGLRVLASSRISGIDLHTATSEWGGPEIALSAACAAQLAHRAGLACDSYGLSTGSIRLDPQAAFERYANSLMPALAGVDILSGVGFMDNAASASLIMAVIDDEILGHLKHIVAGVQVTPAALAFDLEREVVPEGGTFLDREQTVEQIGRGCFWIPGVSERLTGTAAEGPGTGIVARAQARAEELLGKHKAASLPANIDRALDDILKEASRETA